MLVETGEGRDLVQAAVGIPAPVELELFQALHHVLAEKVQADCPYPPFTRSRMDGYAVDVGDLESASPRSPRYLEIAGVLPAGAGAGKRLPRGKTYKIMTGAPLPPGAGAVVPREEVTSSRKGARFTKKVREGANISSRGEEIREGQGLLEAGVVIGPGEAALLAAAGYARVKVYPRPRVGILVTGEEIILPGEKMTPGKIRNTNSYMLAGLVLGRGGEPVFMGTAGDRKGDLQQRIQGHIPSLDLVVTTGGAAGGDYDLIEEVFRDLGAGVLFNQVAMKPGKFTTAAILKGKVLLGFPGSPAGALVSFQQFAVPLLEKMQGRDRVADWGSCRARSVSDLGGGYPEDRFFKAHTFFREGCIYTRVQGPGLASLAGLNSLVYLPRGEGPVKAGSPVRVRLLGRGL